MSTKLDWVDAEELAAHVCGLDTENYTSEKIEDALYDRFECSFEQFHEIAEALVKFTPINTSAITGNKYRGFVKDDWFIVKVDA